MVLLYPTRQQNGFKMRSNDKVYKERKSCH